MEMNLEKLSHVTEKMSRKIKLLQQNEKDQDKYIKAISQNQSSADTKNESKFREIMQELHSASEFIQYQTESLSEQIKKSEKKNNEEIMKNALADLKSQVEVKQEENSQSFSLKIDDIEKKVNVLLHMSDDLKRITESQAIKTNVIEVYIADEFTKTINKSQSELENLQESIFNKLEEKEGIHMSKLNEFTRKSDTLEESLANIPSTVETSQNETINILSTKAKADIQDFDVKIKEMEKKTEDILTKIASLNEEIKSVSSTIDMYDTVIHDNTKVMHIIKQEVFQRLLSTAQTSQPFLQVFKTLMKNSPVNKKSFVVNMEIMKLSCQRAVRTICLLVLKAVRKTQTTIVLYPLKNSLLSTYQKVIVPKKYTSS